MKLTKKLTHILQVGYILLLAAMSFLSCAPPTIKPNIILIMTDDQGWYDVGFNGNQDLNTPYIDSLAKKGVIFDRFYSASAVCSPTRASVLTGRNPLRMNIPYANAGHLKQEETTIPEILQREGYATGHFGKWHLGTLTKSILDANRGGRQEYLNEYSIPSEHGYDVSFCTESKVPTFDPMVFPTSFVEGESKRYGWRAIMNEDSMQPYGTSYWTHENHRETSNVRGDNSRVIMDRVLDFVDHSRQADKPFFTTLWFHTPHLPVVSDSMHRKQYEYLDLQRQLYYGTISALDEQIGRLWNALRVVGIQDDTIIFFCSDNGPERDTPGSAGNFRERKRSLYEGGIRVPAFVIWENGLDGGRRIDFPAFTSDYLLTIVDMLDIEYLPSGPIDGISLLKAIKGDETKRKSSMGFICKPQVSWVTQQYKLIGDGELENLELYDLVLDKSETKNIIDDYPQVAEEMKFDLTNWLNSVEDSKNGLDY